jgi:hypothetical protein
MPNIPNSTAREVGGVTVAKMRESSANKFGHKRSVVDTFCGDLHMTEQSHGSISTRSVLPYGMHCRVWT